MITQYINISDYKYRVELLKNNIDLVNQDVIEDSYIMIRSYEWRNGVIYDTDMYFIEKSLFYNYIYRRSQNKSDNIDLTSGLVFPVTYQDFESFSLNIDDFNNDMNDGYFNEYINNKITDGDDIDTVINNIIDKSPLIYKLYKKDSNNYNKETNSSDVDYKFIETNIHCDKLRIYPPHTNKSIPFIVHIDTYVNNLHVHVLARDINWYYRKENKDKCIKSDTEFSYYHDIYNEYIELTIPDIDELFSGDIFFRENLNYGDIYYIDEKSRDDKLLKRFDELSRTANNILYNSFAIYNIPFTLESFDEVHNLKGGYYLIDENNYYLKDHNDNFLVYKEGELDGSEYLIDKDGYYLKDHLGNYLVCQASDMDNIYSISDMTFNIYSAYIKHYIPEYLHTTAKIQMKNAFSVSFIPYNNSYYYNIFNTDSNVNNKYIYDRIVYGFGKHNMLVYANGNNGVRTQFFMFSSIKLQSHIGFDDNGIISLINKFTYPGEQEGLFNSFSEAYEFFNGISLDDYTNIIDDEDIDDWWDDNSSSSAQCGCIFEMFSDKFQKDIIYKETFPFKVDKESGKLIIEDFAFNLNGMFLSWQQFPGIVYIRIRFVDKYLGKVIYGNICTLTKESFKYLINDNVSKSRAVINNINTNNTNNINTMDVSKINFLNNIKVNVITNNDNNKQSTVSDRSSKTKIIYKPIFYKVQDVQNIVIRTGLIQNIGINLSDYMTKVETFKLVINNTVIVEYGRNNSFVIFNINANNIINNSSSDITSGQYHILNQDDEYITSGNWSLV